jgi:hypothetical protein
MTKENEMPDVDVLPIYCTMRDSDDVVDLECRFENEKYAAVQVCDTKQKLARKIHDFINRGCKDSDIHDEVLNKALSLISEANQIFSYLETRGSATLPAFDWMKKAHLFLSAEAAKGE